MKGSEASSTASNDALGTDLILRRFVRESRGIHPTVSTEEDLPADHRSFFDHHGLPGRRNFVDAGRVVHGRDRLRPGEYLGHDGYGLFGDRRLHLGLEDAPLWRPHRQGHGPQSRRRRALARGRRNHRGPWPAHRVCGAVPSRPRVVHRHLAIRRVQRSQQHLDLRPHSDASKPVLLGIFRLFDRPRFDAFRAVAHRFGFLPVREQSWTDRLYAASSRRICGRRPRRGGARADRRCIADRGVR